MRLIGLVVVLGLALAPLAAEGQHAGRVWRIGVLSTVPTPPLENPFREGLREHGYVEGRNLVLEWRYSEGRNERFPDFAAELVRSKVDVIVTVTNLGALAAKNATSTIPIVMGSSVSPEAAGLVASLARPAGNVTGLSINTGPEMAGKLLQLLKEVAPKISRVAVLHATTPTSRWFKESGDPVMEVTAAAQALGITLDSIMIKGPDDLASAFAAIPVRRAEALLVESSSLVFGQRSPIVESAAKQRLPAVYPFKEFVADGGLMAYGVDLKDMYRRAATYVDKILKGAKPADLPVEQPTKFELVVNMKTAKALGLMIPQSILLRADQVIE